MVIQDLDIRTGELLNSRTLSSLRPLLLRFCSFPILPSSYTTLNLCNLGVSTMKLFAKSKPAVPKKLEGRETEASSSTPAAGLASSAPPSNALDEILTADGTLKKPLESLNSKQRRLLRRKLGRDPTASDEAKPTASAPPAASEFTEKGDAPAIKLDTLSEKAKEKLVRVMASERSDGADDVYISGEHDLISSPCSHRYSCCR